MRGVAAAAALVAAVATVTPTSMFPQGGVSASESHEVAPLSGVASTLAGKPVTVNCWSRSDWASLLQGYPAYRAAAAFANIEAAQIQISPDACVPLGRILAGRPVGEFDAALGVGVLAHEAQHTAGVRDEAAAECGGMRTLPQAAEQLGYDAAEATRLMRIYRGTIYPHAPPSYRAASCRAGLPGIALPNEFGPRASVTRLRADVRRVAAAAGWSRRPAPFGPLSQCALVPSRSVERARVEELWERGRVQLDATGVEFKTRAQALAAFARLRAAAQCGARLAGVTTQPLQLGHPRAAGMRTRVRGVVEDLIVVVDRTRPVVLALAFTSRSTATPAAVERAAIRAALRRPTASP